MKSSRLAALGLCCCLHLCVAWGQDDQLVDMDLKALMQMDVVHVTARSTC
jgi:hypothetical protein